MILSCVKDETLERAVRLVASPDEDVFRTGPSPLAPVRAGFPRLVIHESSRPVFETPRIGSGYDSDIPTIVVTAGTLARWRFERRLNDLGGDLESEFALRLRDLVSAVPRIPWVDGVFRAIERAAGAAPPAAFRGFARRVLEYPGHYSSLGVLADRVGLTVGAIQGRFLRRGLKSPSEHLRWLRILAVAEGLGDPALTLGAAADLFGYTSAGNLCRSVQAVAGKAPTALRDPVIRIGLQARFAQIYLSAEQERVGWAALEDLFWDVPPADAAPAGLTA